MGGPWTASLLRDRGRREPRGEDGWVTGPTFTFHHEWSFAAPREAVLAALADIEGYPAWWPQVRAVGRLDERSGRARIRSALPLTLHLVLTREIEDHARGRLRVRLDGDLEGWAQWSVDSDPQGGGACATFDQDVRVAAPGGPGGPPPPARGGGPPPGGVGPGPRRGGR
ncbi:SRPBCC family protein [Janibacter hoylei]|uniref:SRPBCC family protein n=1 Tax=Janibacter hoylei TaxID=364298 RepID=UPI0036A6FB63